ncbi:hypothetical protein R5R35_010091 [Gryllus longicercus]|uniref:Protein phosphatase 1 regulatory subunit 42 n=1 Tax=Gryllus longicercus TaxID=2509291 RepID=A0AAN9VIE9_9ORTH
MNLPSPWQHTACFTSVQSVSREVTTMVKLTTSYLSSKSSGVLAKKNKDQTNYDFLRKKTQLMLHDQKIDDIGDFSICRNLTILYLHNNCLTEIKYLDHAINLTHLYLQNNKISKIENLEKLKNLCKLYLGFNEISVVEGLEAQENLEELHLEKQRLAEGEELHFDPRSMDTLAGCLRVLDVSGDGLRTLAGAKRLRALERLRAAGNPLQASEALAATMDAGAWPCLRELDVRGSPASRERRHRRLVVAAAPVSLHMLDGREVAEVQRNFLRGMQSCHRRASETALPTAVDPEPLLHALAPEVGEMALRLPPAVRRAVSRTLLEETAAAASAFGFGAGAGGGGGGGGGASSLALPLPSAPLHPTFPAWRQPQTPLVMEGGGDGVCGLGDGSVGVVGLPGPKGRVRAKVPRPFWRHRAATGPRNPPSRTSSTCPLRLPEL